MTHICVLMGGVSSERNISLISGAAVSKSLRANGFDVTTIDAEKNLPLVLSGLSPDIVFNALHGRYGEDGNVQGLLEMLSIPYTHSGVLASALAMDKFMAKKMFLQAGLRCTEGDVYTRDEVRAGGIMEPPYVVKPVNEGSSMGVHIVFNQDNGTWFSEENWRFGDRVLVERYVPGREMTVAILDDRALGVTEIRSANNFYDYDAKYSENKSKHLVPAPLPQEKYQEALDISLTAHRALGCRGVSRADLRYDDTSGNGEFYLMEINTQPGFTPVSLVPEIAAYAGISFSEVVTWLVEDAGCNR